MDNDSVSGYVSFATTATGPAVVAAPGEYGLRVSVRPAGGRFGPLWQLGQDPASSIPAAAVAVDDAGDVFVARPEDSSSPGTLYWDALPAP